MAGDCTGWSGLDVGRHTEGYQSDEVSAWTEGDFGKALIAFGICSSLGDVIVSSRSISKMNQACSSRSVPLRSAELGRQS